MLLTLRPLHCWLDTPDAALLAGHPCCSPELSEPASMPSNTYPFFSAGSPCTHTHTQLPQAAPQAQHRSAPASAQRSGTSPPARKQEQLQLPDSSEINTYRHHSGATAPTPHTKTKRAEAEEGKQEKGKRGKGERRTSHLVVVHILHCVCQAAGGAHHRDGAVPQRNHLHDASGRRDRCGEVASSAPRLRPAGKPMTRDPCCGSSTPTPNRAPSPGPLARVNPHPGRPPTHPPTHPPRPPTHPPV